MCWIPWQIVLEWHLCVLSARSSVCPSQILFICHVTLRKHPALAQHGSLKGRQDATKTTCRCKVILPPHPPCCTKRNFTVGLVAFHTPWKIQQLWRWERGRSAGTFLGGSPSWSGAPAASLHRLCRPCDLCLCLVAVVTLKLGSWPLPQVHFIWWPGAFYTQTHTDTHTTNTHTHKHLLTLDPLKENVVTWKEGQMEFFKAITLCAGFWWHSWN